MSDYKPLTDEELHGLAEDVGVLDPTTDRLVKQARRANALALSMLSGNPYHLSDEQRSLLHAYLGETK